ncbi:MAG TPA: hypothetical protein VNI77_00370 [Nitrososphaera sp.]|nr:hypothetical protein [Nitrososphaera sp.]
MAKIIAETTPTGMVAFAIKAYVESLFQCSSETYERFIVLSMDVICMLPRYDRPKCHHERDAMNKRVAVRGLGKKDVRRRHEY